MTSFATPVYRGTRFPPNLVASTSETRRGRELISASGCFLLRILISHLQTLICGWLNWNIGNYCPLYTICTISLYIYRYIYLWTAYVIEIMHWIKYLMFCWVRLIVDDRISGIGPLVWKCSSMVQNFFLFMLCPSSFKDSHGPRHTHTHTHAQKIHTLIAINAIPISLIFAFDTIQ